MVGVDRHMKGGYKDNIGEQGTKENNIFDWGWGGGGGGGRETRPFISGEHGDIYPPPLWEICLQYMNMFARFDENPAMTLQDVKETKRYGWTHLHTDGQHENSIPTTNIKTILGNREHKKSTFLIGGGGGGGIKTILGNREHKKTIFLIGGGQGNTPLYFRGTWGHLS